MTEIEQLRQRLSEVEAERDKALATIERSFDRRALLDADLTELRADQERMREALEEARKLFDRLQRCDELAGCQDCMHAVEDYLAALSSTPTPEHQ